MYSYRKIYKVISSMLAVLLLSINLGFSVDIHFCGGNIADFAIYGQAHSCGELENNTFCKMKTMSTSIMKSPLTLKPLNTCCKDFNFIIQLEVDSEIINYVDLSTKGYKLMPKFVPVIPQYKYFEPELKIQKEEHNIYYLTPLISRDIYVLFERYLI